MTSKRSSPSSSRPSSNHNNGTMVSLTFLRAENPVSRLTPILTWMRALALKVVPVIGWMSNQKPCCSGFPGVIPVEWKQIFRTQSNQCCASKISDMDENDSACSFSCRDFKNVKILARKSRLIFQQEMNNINSCQSEKINIVISCWKRTDFPNFCFVCFVFAQILKMIQNVINFFQNT